MRVPMSHGRNTAMAYPLPEENDPWVSVGESLPPYQPTPQELHAAGLENTASSQQSFRGNLASGLRSLIPGSSKNDDILIAVMGMTGVGKTSFISDVTGKEMKIGHDLESCTKEIEVVTTQINERTVHLIDTPGFDDTNLKDSDILITIADYLQDAGQEVRLSGLLYLHRITDPRVGSSAMKNIRMFRKLVGEENMKNVMLVTTFWNQVAPEDGARRQQQLQDTGDFWGDLIRYGATCYNYKNRPADAHSLIQTVMENQPKVTRLQKELQRGTTLSKTAAGREVAQEMEKLKADYEAKLKQMQQEMKSAQKEKDEMLAEDLKAYYEKLLAEQKAAAEAKERFYERELEGLQTRLTAVENKWGCTVM